MSAPPRSAVKPQPSLQAVQRDDSPTDSSCRAGGGAGGAVSVAEPSACGGPALRIDVPVPATPGPSGPASGAKYSQDFLRKYTVHHKLGEGAFSSVHKAVSRQTGDEFALKVIDLRPLRLSRGFEPDRLKREVRIMKALRPHPNIVRLFDVFETRDFLMMVVELVKGGELFARILDAGVFTEVEAKCIIKQVRCTVVSLTS